MLLSVIICGFPLGDSTKWILLSTILYEPLYILADEESVWVVADDPTNPLETFTKGIVPIFVIGPWFVVPNPTFSIFIYSLSILRISFGTIVDIPLKANIEDAIEIVPPFPDNVCTIGVLIIGYCTILSKVIIAFSFFLYISSWCAFPEPIEENTTPFPVKASFFVSANLNLLESSLIT